MSYKVKSLLLCCSFSCLLAFCGNAAAQGVVTLSEEAMFDDELETNKDFPGAQAAEGEIVLKSPNAPAAGGAVIPKGPNAPAPEGAVVPKGSNAPVPEGAVVPKGPNAPAPEGAIVPKGPNAPAAQLDTPQPKAVVKSSTSLMKTDKDADVDDLFSQMSDIERNTALLNLELRREKLQNEIEAVKNQRRLAIEQEKQKAEELKLKQREKEQEQERKKLEEQQKLRELDIEFETLRQERILKAYKNQMLEEQQKWINHDALFYKTIADLRQEKTNLANKYKDDMTSLQREAQNAYRAYQDKLEQHKNEVSNLNSQIDVLRSRLSSLEQEMVERSRNPFAGGDEGGAPSGVITSGEASASSDSSAAIVAEPTNNSLAKYYAVIEIRGKGGELVAKLINKNGLSFYVKKGTTLQSGHVISEITSTYVAADKNYKKDYIYFSAGGILPEEVDTFKIEKTDDD
ncbi:MAG: hypothetical protein IJ184_06160 [Alphaproteobacteria bacterium]|nr:hypothetical protein [Alphaproteobacteria bacterium]